MHAGNNAQPPADAILGVHFVNFLKAEDVLKETKAGHKDVLKALEDKGFNVKAAKIAAPILRQGTVATRAYAALIRDVLALLEVAGAPVESDQIEMFPARDPATPADERAYQAGRSAAFFQQASGDNPHDLSTVQGQEWLRGWNQGNVEVDLIMAMQPEADEHIKGDDPFADDQLQAAE